MKLLTSLVIGLSAITVLYAPARALHDSAAVFSQFQLTVTAAAAAPPAPQLPTALYPQIVANPLSYQTIVNKKFQLASSFAPSDLSAVNVSKASDEPLRAEAARAIEHLFAGAANAGIPLRLTSAYRSFEHQKALYASYVQLEGLQSAEASSARPGYSEHQTGLAADFAALHSGQTNIANNWVAANGPEYGFVVRYPAGKELITGYKYEPWHIRYVGVDTAKALKAKGQVMEEYFKVPGGGYGQ